MSEAKQRGTFEQRRLEAMEKQGLKFKSMIVFSSDNPDEGPWSPVMRDDLPDWLKNDPDVMGLLVAGMVVQNETQGGPYYRAEKPEEKKGIIIQ